MKKLCLGLLIAGAFTAGSAFAQDCTTPGTWTPDAGGTPSVGADLCAGTDTVALYCDFLDSANKNDAVWQVSIAPGYTATSISVGGTGAGFNPVIYMYTAGCTTGSGCQYSGDAGNPIDLQGVVAAPGNYFLAASAASSDASGACGAVTLTTNGTFPVALQSFSVE